jgi:hypothetical protein
LVNEGASASYALPVITDPESDACSITILAKPDWVTFSAGSNTFTINPPLSSAGTYPVNFNLQDSANSVPQTFSVVVLTAPPTSNGAPAFSEGLND